MRRGLFLDFDGTLVDSLPQLRAAYSGFLRIYGVEGSPEEFEELNGPSLTEIVQRLRDRYHLDASHTDLMRHYQDVLQDHESHIRLHDGAYDLLNTAASQGFLIAIVTSSSGGRVEGLLKRTGLESAINLVIGSELSSNSKPHPDPYLVAINDLSADPVQSIAVEDSPAGVAAATAAGLPVVLVGPGKPPSSIPLLASVRSLSDVIPFLDSGP